MGKAKSSRIDLKKKRNVPLERQIEESKVVKAKPDRPAAKKKDGDDDEQAGDRFLDPKTTRQILRSARKHQKELEDEFGAEEGQNSDEEFPALSASGQDEDGSKLMDEMRINADEEAAFESFRNKESSKGQTLGDFIAEVIKKKEQMVKEGKVTDTSSVDGKHVKLDHRVVQMYKGVREVMSKYRSGKVPKAFKVIPNLMNWEQVLEITNPDGWTAASMFIATRMFANQNDKMAQRFYNLILLPRIRDDIDEYKRLNYHLYQSLRRALFRPAAFFKGIVLPLVESGDCTLREAVIISSVLARNSIPMLHSAACLLKIADMEYSGASSVFMHTLINKRYALPYRVIDALVDHFVRFRSEKRLLPVLWHQTLLAFVKHYAADIASEQREAIFDLIKVQSHWQISDVIREILNNSKPRDEEEGIPIEDEERDDRMDDK